MRSRIFLAEDCALMREAICSILALECELLGWVDDGRKVLDTAKAIGPDVIVLDISLPGISGLTLLPELRSSLPGTGIVILTTHTSDEYVEEAFRRGANEYVLKSEAHMALLPAVRQAASPQALSTDLAFKHQLNLRLGRACSLPASGAAL